MDDRTAENAGDDQDQVDNSKRSIAAALLAGLGVVALSACTTEGGADGEENNRAFGQVTGTTNSNLFRWVQTIGTIANPGELRTTCWSPQQQDGDVLVAEGFWQAGDGGGGVFYWQANSSETDDGGTIISHNCDSPSGRWKRIYSGPLNVKWFGAHGNDSNAEETTVAFQRALDTAGMTDARSVYVPPGTYQIRTDSSVVQTVYGPHTTGLVVHSNTTITIDAILKAVWVGANYEWGSVFFIGGDPQAPSCNVTIRGGRLEGNPDNSSYPSSWTWNNAIWIAGASDVLIVDMEISHFCGAAISIQAGYKTEGYWSPSRIVVQRVKSHQNHQNGIEVVCGTQVTFEDCSVSEAGFQSAGRPGFDIEAESASFAVSHITVRGCSVDCCQTGILVSDSSNVVGDVWIVDNKVCANTTHGIWVTKTGEGIGTMRARVEGNHALNNGQMGILIQQVLGATVTENYVAGNGWEGIKAYGADGAVFSDNQCRDNAGQIAQGANIVVTFDSANCIVSGNRCSGPNALGIRLTSDTSHNLVVANVAPTIVDDGGTANLLGNNLLA